jgi:uncharacterized protein YacL
MNDAHLHLLFNHFPIVGTFISLAVLGIGFIINNSTVKKTAYGILIFCAIMTLPAFFTGEGAEEIVEEFPGVSHDVIHEHEEMAELSLWIGIIAGIVAAFALYFEVVGHIFARAFSLFSLLINLACFIVMARVGNTGGEIRHPEIIGKTAVSSNKAAETEVEDD